MYKVNLDRDWDVVESGLLNNIFFSQLKWKKIDLPHDATIEKKRDPNSPAGASEGYTVGCSLYYRKELEIKEEWKNKNLILEFEGVMGITEIFINDKLVKKHFNGYTSFLVDITEYIKEQEKATIIVHVKNTHKPSSRWYAGTGIYRHVWLNIGGDVYIKPWHLHVKTDSINEEIATLSINANIINSSFSDKNIRVLFEILSKENDVIQTCEEKLIINSKEEKKANKKLKLSPFIYWDIDNPYLYTVKVTIYDENNDVLDTAISTFGIRTISVDPKEGFKLNGKLLKLKGGCIHHDNGLLGSASYDRAEERKVEILKQNGFNAIRTAHNPFSPSFLDACDRLGMLVIEEFFDVWEFGKLDYDYHIFFEKYWEEDITSTIVRDYNHPSIIIWSIGNEVTWGAGCDIDKTNLWCEKLSKKVRELDNTRFVTSAVPSFWFEFTERNIIQNENFFVLDITPKINPSNDKWGEITEKFFSNLDIAGYNYKINRYEYDRNKYLNRVICGTETHPYTSYENWMETLKNPNVIGDFVWTAMDYLGESGIGRVCVGFENFKGYLGEYPWFISGCGNIDICGEKKPQSYYRDVVWGLRDEPYIVVLPPEFYDKTLVALQWGWEPVERCWNFPGYEGKPVRIYVYANVDEVELFLNGKSYGKKECNEKTKFKAKFDLVYEQGILVVIGYKDGKEIGRDMLKTTKLPVKIKAYPDRFKISSRYGDLCFIKIEAVDDEGNWVPNAENEIRVSVNGVGELIALGTSNPFIETPFNRPNTKLYKGRALAIVKSIGEKGQINIKVEGNNLEKNELSIECI